MKIAVKNFGPIKHGEIDLSKRFYVFVGHNNSGKTYMANLMWEFEKMSFNISNDKLIDELASNELYHPKVKNDKFIFSEEQITHFAKKYIHLLKNKLADNLKISSEHFLFKNTSFSGTLTQQNKTGNKSSIAWVLRDKDEYNQYTVFNYRKSHNGYSVKKSKEKITLKEGEYLIETIRELNQPFNIISSGKAPSLEKEIPFTIRVILHSLNTNPSFPFFLPSERTFYPKFYTHIYKAIQDESEDFNTLGYGYSYGDELIRSELVNKSKLPYKKSVSDILSNLITLRNRAKNHYSHLIEKLKPILSGDIVARSAEGIGPSEFRLHIEDKKELELYLSSSAANQLTTLYLYLKYWAKEKNNLLIIDEPEENLHPKSQLLLLNVLMEFANMNNNRVVITTHSPLMAEAVNNHIQVAKLQDLGVDVEKIIEENGFDIGVNDNIRHKDFGVYFFGHGTITPYDVADYGVYFRDFKQEQKKVERMANTFSDHIYDAINEQELVNA